jgi:predicted nucleotidyltransferase
MIPSKEEIIDIIKFHPLKVRNIYLFGSQVYGNQREDSDYDFIVVACSMLEKQEIRHEKLNIHIHTPDIFLEGLKEYQMQYLECIYAPEFAKIQEKMVQPDKNFSLKLEMLKYKAMGQSFNAFHKAKERIIDGETYRGVKSLWHSIRILDFFKQIIENGKIIDFSSSNIYWNMILEDFESHGDGGDDDWDFYKGKYLPIKIGLENFFK